jgi:hypothetical protein
MPATLIFDVIPAEAGTQGTSPPGLGPLPNLVSRLRPADRKAAHLFGPVIWAPAFAGVTPSGTRVIHSRNS